MNIMDRCIDDLYMHIYSKKKVSNNHSLSTCALMAVNKSPTREKHHHLLPPKFHPKKKKRKREKERIINSPSPPAPSQ